jgi:hypothetical protein
VPEACVGEDTAGDIHIEFHGRAHTAGDIAGFSPQKRVVASGDVIIGFDCRTSPTGIRDRGPRQSIRRAIA